MAPTRPDITPPPTDKPRDDRGHLRKQTEDDQVAEDDLEALLAADEEDDDRDQNVPEDALEGEPEEDEKSPNRPRPPEERRPKKEPGQKRSENEQPQEPKDLNQAAPERQADFTHQPAGETAGKTAAEKTGQAAGKAAQGAEKAGETVAKAGEEAAEVAQTATRLGELATAAGEAIAAAGESLVATGGAIATALGGWTIPVILLCFGIALVLGYGVMYGYTKWKAGSGTGGTKIAQVADPTKPDMAAAIERLKALSGDPKALNDLIASNSTDLDGIMDQMTSYVTANAPDKTKNLMTQELDKARTALSSLRASGANMDNPTRSALIGAVFYSLQRVISLSRGVLVAAVNPTGKDVVNSAAAVLNNAAGWVYTTNETDLTKPLRDGTNFDKLTKKQGCDSPGYITYIIRGDNTQCMKGSCITPTIDKLTLAFGSLFTSYPVQNDSPDVALAPGDIVLTSTGGTKPTLEGFVVMTAPVTGKLDQTTVSYCGTNGLNNGPALSAVLTGGFPGAAGDAAAKRTITNYLRVNSPQRANST